MEKAKKGDMKALMLKAKLNKPSKIQSAEQKALMQGVSAEPKSSNYEASAGQKASSYGGSAEQKPMMDTVSTRTKFTEMIMKDRPEDAIKSNMPVRSKYSPVTDYLKKKRK